MKDKELIKATFFDYVKKLSEKNSLNEKFKEFERLFNEVKNYRLAFVYYMDFLRKNDTSVDKKLEGDFFAEFIW